MRITDAYSKIIASLICQRGWLLDMSKKEVQRHWPSKTRGKEKKLNHQGGRAPGRHAGDKDTHHDDDGADECSSKEDSNVDNEEEHLPPLPAPLELPPSPPGPPLDMLGAAAPLEPPPSPPGPLPPAPPGAPRHGEWIDWFGNRLTKVKRQNVWRGWQIICLRHSDPLRMTGRDKCSRSRLFLVKGLPDDSPEMLAESSRVLGVLKMWAASGEGLTKELHMAQADDSDPPSEDELQTLGMLNKMHVEAERAAENVSESYAAAPDSHHASGCDADSSVSDHERESDAAGSGSDPASGSGSSSNSTSTSSKGTTTDGETGSRDSSSDSS